MGHLFFSCKTKEPNTNSIEGIWKSIGYGKILKIDTTSYQYHDITDLSCISSKRGKILEVKESMELKNDTLAVKKGYSIYYYLRADQLPNVCLQNKSDAINLLYNFEVLANTYKNHYAFFNLNHIDWDSL